MSSLNLRGGLGNDTAMVAEKSQEEMSALDIAIYKMACVKNSQKQLSSLSGNRKIPVKGGRRTIKELADHVNDLANLADEFISHTAMPSIHEFGRDPSMRDQIAQYEADVNDLVQFCPNNDPDKVLQAETWFEGMDALCLRVSNRAQLAELVFSILYAGSKDEVEDLLAKAQYTELTDEKDENGRRKTRHEKVFKGAANTQRADTWAFGRGYDLTTGAFGYYRDFAKEKLATAMSTRSIELAKAYKTEIEQRKKEIFAGDASRVSPEDLFFGEDRKSMNGKSAVIAWKHDGFENAITLQLDEGRDGERLYLLNALGKAPQEALARMRESYGSKPFVLLSDILTRDGQMLCPENWVNGRPRYSLNGFIEDQVKLQMTCWVRTAAGHACPSRVSVGGAPNVVLGKESNGNGRKRVVKGPGEFLTDQEFFFRGLGGYALVYERGFNHKVYGKDGLPTGEVVTLSEPASLYLERQETSNGDELVFCTVSSTELARLLEAGGVTIYGEGPDGKILINARFKDESNWKNLPVVLANGLKRSYGRMRTVQTVQQ